MALTAPTIEEARRLSRRVDTTQGFVATIMSPTAGSRARQLHSIGEVDWFLETRNAEDFELAGYRLDIHYMDFGFLADWLDEIIGDAELAAAVRDVNRSGKVFGYLVPEVKALLQERIEQCRAAIESEAETVPVASE